MSMNEGLLLYAYGMQGAYGDIKTDKPPIWNVIERSKWDSWNSVKGID